MKRNYKRPYSLWSVQGTNWQKMCIFSQSPIIYVTITSGLGFAVSC
jgi:hypothetical protein